MTAAHTSKATPTLFLSHLVSCSIHRISLHYYDRSIDSSLPIGLYCIKALAIWCSLCSKIAISGARLRCFPIQSLPSQYNCFEHSILPNTIALSFPVRSLLSLPSTIASVASQSDLQSHTIHYEHIHVYRDLAFLVDQEARLTKEEVLKEALGKNRKPHGTNGNCDGGMGSIGTIGTVLGATEATGSRSGSWGGYGQQERRQWRPGWRSSWLHPTWLHLDTATADPV